MVNPRIPVRPIPARRQVDPVIPLAPVGAFPAVHQLEQRAPVDPVPDPIVHHLDLEPLGALQAVNQVELAIPLAPVGAFPAVHQLEQRAPIDAIPVVHDVEPAPVLLAVQHIEAEILYAPVDVIPAVLRVEPDVRQQIAQRCRDAALHRMIPPLIPADENAFAERENVYTVAQLDGQEQNLNIYAHAGLQFNGQEWEVENEELAAPPFDLEEGNELNVRVDALRVIAVGRAVADDRGVAARRGVTARRGVAVRRGIAVRRGVAARRPGRPPGTTAAVMAARRAADTARNEEGPDENRVFQHHHIRAIIRNREERARNIAAQEALDGHVMDRGPRDRQVVGPVRDRHVIEGPIVANVECCICQTQRSNRVSDCGHLYCEECINAYLTTKRNAWMNNDFERFDARLVQCAYCREALGRVGVVHLN